MPAPSVSSLRPRPAGRPVGALTICALTISALAIVFLPGRPAAAQAGGATIPLPDRSQLAPAVSATDLLGPDRPNEVINRSPGPIDDTEQVVVGLAPDGSPASVRVSQRLVITGVGDFSLKIPGPAIDVHAAAGASNQPGLRRGSVIWEGFAGGRKELAADVELHPDIEALRLPLAVTVTGTEVRIENRTAVPVPMADGQPSAGAAESALAAVRAALAAGTAPLAGAGGVPAAIPVQPGSPAPSTTDVPVAVPFHVRGEVASPSGAVPFDAIVPGPAAPGGVLVVPAAGPVRFTAEPSLPDPATVAPAAGRDALRALETAMWSSLRRDDVAAYLGNPKPGHSSTTFVFEPAAPRRSPVAAVAKDEPKPLAIAVVIALATLVIAGAGVLWARN